MMLRALQAKGTIVSKSTHKLRILIMAMAVGSMTVLGFASTAHANDDDDPASAEICLATICLPGDS
jgi:hypothetical protein